MISTGEFAGCSNDTPIFVASLTIRIAVGSDMLDLVHETVNFIAGLILKEFFGGRLMQPKKPSLSTLSNDALCKLRDEIAALLNSRAENLRRELEQLTATAVAHHGKANGRGDASKAQRKKIAPKYRGADGETWTGRGMTPRWLTRALKEGKALEDFLIVAGNGASN